MQLSERIGRRMKLQDLHVLMTVVQTGSMGKAADRLNTSQPNISRSIADLEHTLGVRLLDRHPHGVEPTAYGRTLLEGGVAVFDELRQTVKNIESLADPESGEVRIGSINPLASGFVTAIVDRLARRYPRITFNLIAGTTESLHHDLHERRFDLLIARRFGALADERLDFEWLFDDTYVVAAGTKNPWVKRRKIELAELAREAWVLPAADSVPGSILMDAMRANGAGNPHAAVISNSPEVRINLLATGRYLTVFSTSSLRFSARGPELQVVPVTLPFDPVPVGFVTLKNRSLGPAAKLFIDAAREVAKPLAKSGR